ncbi:class 1 fructose-bisphosphatase [Anthocerotibacter panamensis]|uniref:class 1 fructose-bisphosphatase n=1 Tax=Anthocerotibacter panamensis TaxID=2857077 RepID=UPI001FD908FB|nr:class 1 fructose-bisphosphatase [Anthocerotibacter panamensis]
MPQGVMTLARYILSRQDTFPDNTGEFSNVMLLIGVAAKTIAWELRRAGLVEDALGLTGEINVQGEQVRKLDDYANEVFLKTFQDTGLVCTIVSEELEGPEHLMQPCTPGSYALLVDPLDGSSNVDMNINTGSIFAIQRRRFCGDDEADLLQAGRKQVAAGYILYGPSTILTFTTGHGVHMFTLDAAIGEFVLSAQSLTIPERGTYYSVNQGNSRRWQPWLRTFLDYLQTEDKASKRPYSLRYVGSLAADIHRTLLIGGIFLYPSDTKSPKGKLRLLYEAAPMAMLLEQAQGQAITDQGEAILDIEPSQIHQRVSVIMGSPYEVGLAQKFLQQSKVPVLG